MSAVNFLNRLWAFIESLLKALEEPFDEDTKD
jgi:hypothetical protein